MTTSVKNNFLPPGLVSNLQEVLLNRKGGSENDPSKSNDESTQPSSSDAVEANSDTECSKPVVLVTNADGIEAPGLNFLVEALVRDGLCNVHVCAPQSWVLFNFSNCWVLCWFFDVGMWGSFLLWKSVSSFRLLPLLVLSHHGFSFNFSKFQFFLVLVLFWCWFTKVGMWGFLLCKICDYFWLLSFFLLC